MSKYWLNSTTKNLRTPGMDTCLHWAKKWHRNVSIYDDPLSRSARCSFAHKQRRNHRSPCEQKPLWFLCLSLKCHPSLRPTTQRAQRVWYRPFEGETKRRMAFQTIRVCARATWFFVQKGTG